MNEGAAERHIATAVTDSERRMAALLENISDAYFTLDGEERFTSMNSRAARILGGRVEGLLGRSIWGAFPDLADSALAENCRRAVAANCPAAFTAFDRRRALWLEVRVHPSQDGLTVYFQDVSSRKALEEQYGQAQRMEALGRLAGGVAHDFNNLLTIIGGYSRMLLDSIETKNPLRKDVEPIVEAAGRASGLTRQLLTFSRRQLVVPKVVDINRLITKMHRMLRRVIGEDIELTLALRPGVGRTVIDPGQIEQVIMNLAVNARDAMPTGGKLGIATENLEIAERASPGLPPGSYVLLTISDTGSGMDEQTRLHVFEPFFTTKAQGTGLGLAMVYGIVKQAGGEIEVESALGQGTRFRIYLPRTRKPARDRHAGATRRPRKGHETILLVEDDAEVRRLTREMLLRLGYRVLDAPNAADALALWHQAPEPIDLLVTDIIMPQVSGRELAAQLTVLRPGLKVLFISGYTDEVIARHGIIPRGAALLEKPFSHQTLGLRVRSILDEEREA
ncbi:MAG TPA: ATP-binding protein [Bryobacteraceae bacterium]